MEKRTNDTQSGIHKERVLDKSKQEEYLRMEERLRRRGEELYLRMKKKKIENGWEFGWLYTHREGPRTGPRDFQRFLDVKVNMGLTIAIAHRKRCVVRVSACWER